MLLLLFRKLLDTYTEIDNPLELYEQIITLRSAFLIDRVLSGLGISFDRALSLLQNNNSFLTEKELQERELLIAAIDNLIDFAVSGEYQVWKQFPSILSKDQFEKLIETFRKYNLTYAIPENEEVLYAATIAAWWLTLSPEALVTYMTQGDERVRAWHLSHEGLTYPKSEFPPELIPPIEWGCRCYLSTNDTRSVVAEGITQPKKENIKAHPVFCESLAKGGRIFSKAHPYFSDPLPKEFIEISNRLKRKLYLSK